MIGPSYGVTAQAPLASPHDTYLRLLAGTLAGYAILGRGFAAVGVPPLFIGEVVLALGLIVLMRTRCWFAMLGTPASVLLAVLILWGVIRTVPFVGVHGVDALRDSVVLVYGLFAFIVVAILLEEPRRLAWIVRAYGGLAWVYGLTGGLLFVASITSAEFVQIPNSEIRLPYVRAGEAASHLAGAAVFTLVGLRASTPLWCTLLIANMALVTLSRAAMLTCLVPVMLAAVLSGQLRRFLPAVLLGLSLLAAAAALDLRVPLPGGRDLGAAQIVEGLESVVGSSNASNFEGTKQFRLNWWATIRNYTFHGPYFWTGKGFGANLAMEDGYQGSEPGESKLRSPHNGHMTILARAGVPGLALWLVLLAVWFGMLLYHAAVASRRRQPRWVSLFLWLTCYGAAILINASFDVALEGPMIGIWFWSLFGLGIGATMIYRAGLAWVLDDDPHRQRWSGTKVSLLPS
ncbi:MAG: O-antigen ligase family protein [Methylobacterium sp.]|uniref:O-antigen ligase family protein n=1 Tax=Methylobacterium sp. TaxID=409 RepID=UPI00258D7E8C|nr:O-antigen ligase family protein [Methylobacterium sp.]MBY0299730.1 O-antigen ligase family protein [Methylobacterium sp.]